jgi:pyruvate dehydrogenase E2 component (dihydrolipoyllysine-residue acetyltransferase)
MAELILMPRLSDTMTEGVIAEWHKKVGDPVKKGDLLAEVETDKATMELESYKDGTLLHIGVDKGGKLQVNDLLAIIGAPGEDISGLLKGGDANKVQPQKAQDAEDKTPKKEEKTKQEPTKTAATTGKATSDKAAGSDQGGQRSSAQGELKQSKQTTATVETADIDISKLEEVVLMPRLSDTMTEGVIAEWHKKVGDTVKKGDILAEIETDKATMELESYKNGTLLYIGAEKGEKIEVNSLLCIIGEKGKVDVDAIVAGAKGNKKGSQAEAEVKTKPISQPKESGGQATVSDPGGSSQAKPTTTSEGNGRIKASPLAKKLAKDKGVDLNLVHGTGDGGRITKADIDKFSPVESKGPSPAGKQVVIPGFTPTTEEGYIDTPNSLMRKTIARRLGESKFSAPHFYLTMEINMDNTIAVRKQMNEFSPVKISFQDILIKACALTLREHPAVNSSWMGEFIRTYRHIHIGSAVAVPEGLIVPVIRFADQKSFAQIAVEAKELYDKARNKKLQPHEFTGHTFTISNLGMMDIEEFTAIINPPDSCILAVGKIKEVVIKKDTGFATSNVMKLTMSCDHRSVDGAVGAAFLQTLKKYMENPVAMLM